MSGLWISQNIKQLLEALFEGENASNFLHKHLKIAVSTSEQKKALKEWIIERYGGALGWDIFTPTEVQRRSGALGVAEVVFLAKAAMPQKYWSLIPNWAAALFSWIQAGYTPEEIPFPEDWKQVTEEIIKKIRQARKKIASQVLVRADIALGFDPLAYWGIEASYVGFVVGRLGVAEEAALASWEKTLGEANWCEVLETHDKKTAVISEIDFAPAISEAFSKNSELKRIVYQGELARAALNQMEIESKKIFHSPETGSWRNDELKKSFSNIYETAAGFSSRHDFLRERIVGGQRTIEELKAEEEKAKKSWAETGLLSVIELPEAALPEMGALEEFSTLTIQILGESVEPIIKRITALGYLLPPKISRELWLEGIADQGRKNDFYRGISILPLESAHGLIDETTLLVWSADIPAPAPGLIEADIIRKKNSEQYKENHIPKRGYIEIDRHRQRMGIKEEALKTATWIRLKDNESKDWKARTYVEKEIEIKKDDVLVKKQSARRDESKPFNENDYTLPLPIKASCKQWESIIATPECGWYQLLKINPLWESNQSLVALCVGTWIHEALSQDATAQGVNRFFEKTKNSNASLTWQQAHMAAWKMSAGFARALQEFPGETVDVEKNIYTETQIDGIKIPLRGRIDRVLRSGEKLLIIDFKTGSSAASMSLKKLDEGDGLQLWLYGRALGTNNIALCRLAPGADIKEQVMMQNDFLEVEKTMAQISKTGILRQRGDWWGRFGQEERLPLATLPIDAQTLQNRRKAVHETL